MESKRHKSRKKKEKNFAWIYIFIFAIAIIGILLFNLPKSIKDQKINSENITKLDFSIELEHLVNCLDYINTSINEKPSEMVDCPKYLKQEYIDKLRLLDNLRGEIVCDSFGKNDTGNTYRNCFQFIRGCNQLFQLVDSRGDGYDKKFYQIYQCKNENFYVYYHISPPEIKVVKVILSENAISGLSILYPE